MTSTERKHPDAKCEKCELRSHAYVPSKIPTSATIAAIGEAPGYYEVESGEPFVGPSGKLLKEVLRHNGIDKDTVFLGNAVACRPTDNETPSTNAINCCRPRLVNELTNSGVSTILTLGNTPTLSLTDESGIKRLRVGPGRDSPYIPAARIIPSYHPAFVLRVPDEITKLSTDVGKIHSQPPIWEPPVYTVAETEDQALNLLAQLIERKPFRLVLDIESNIEKDASFEQPQQHDLLCVGIQYDRKKCLVLGENSLTKPVFASLAHLVNHATEVGYQNGKFDRKGLFAQCGLLKQTFDTQYMSYALDEHPGIHNLEYMGRELIGAPDWKHVLDKYEPKKNGYGVIPRPVLYKYNAYDCDITWEVAVILEKRMEIAGVWKVHDFIIECLDAVLLMEINGIGIDLEYMNELDDILIRELSRSKSYVESLLPDASKNYETEAIQKKNSKFGIESQINLNSPKQVMAAFNDFGITIDSTDEKHCHKIIERLEPAYSTSPTAKKIVDFIKALLEYRGIAKEKSTYVDGLRSRLYGGKVYSNFLLHGTTSGRLSSRNPNLQNIPRGPKLRKLFVATRPDFVLVQTDYSQAELRIIAWLAQDSYFTPIFNDGTIDVFDSLTGDLFPNIDKATTPKEEWKEIRSKRVKPFVYGLAYGRTEYGLAADPTLGMDLPEAKKIMNNFMSLIPDIVTWQKKVKWQVESGYDLVTPFGRHRRFPLITNENHDNAMREALAFIPSSTSSDICLRALSRVRRDLVGKAWIRNMVHDSILVECHKDRAEEVRESLERRMLESAIELCGDYVAFQVESSIGRSWGDLS